MYEDIFNTFNVIYIQIQDRRIVIYNMHFQNSFGKLKLVHWLILWILQNNVIICLNCNCARTTYPLKTILSLINLHIISYHLAEGECFSFIFDKVMNLKRNTLFSSFSGFSRWKMHRSVLTNDHFKDFSILYNFPIDSKTISSIRSLLWARK